VTGNVPRWLPPALAAFGVALIVTSVSWIATALRSEEFSCRAAGGYWVATRSGGTCIELEEKR
jgi:hypothetical protein